MAQTFTEFFNQKVLQDRLPFNVDFQIETIANEAVTEVVGYKLRTKGDLTTAESWFMESVDSINNSQVTALNLTLRQLLVEFKNIFDLKDLEEARKYFFNPPKKIVNTPEYEEFEEAHTEDLGRLNEGFLLAEDSRCLNWLRVTFFMKTRYDVEWSMGKTAMLSDKEIEAIMLFIATEANGGVPPEPVKEAEVVTEGKLALEE